MFVTHPSLTHSLHSQVGDCAINAMLRAALAKEVALLQSQRGTYIAFTRNDFNKCFVSAYARVQVCSNTHSTHTYTSYEHNTHSRTHTYTHSRTHTQTHTQEQLLAELIANPVPSPPEPLTTMEETAVPPSVVNGTEITIHDLMVGESADKLKDQHLSEWLDAREKLGIEKMAETTATGLPEVDPSVVRTLANKYREDRDKTKCRGNAITRSCAFTGSFVILECGRRVLYPHCPGNVTVSVMCVCMYVCSVI